MMDPMFGSLTVLGLTGLALVLAIVGVLIVLPMCVLLLFSIRKVEPGKADRSYGIEVARLAGFPDGVIERARSVLARHEQGEQTVSQELSSDSPGGPVQVSIFTPTEQGIAEELKSLNLDEMRPIEALALLEKIVRVVAVEHCDDTARGAAHRIDPHFNFAAGLLVFRGLAGG